MSDYGVGDRVHVEFDAAVAENDDLDGLWVDLVIGKQALVLYLGETPITITKIEPEYEHGAMYVDHNGYYFQCDQPEPDMTRWLIPGMEGFATPAPPLRKLVPEEPE